MKKDLHIALIEFDIAWENPSANLIFWKANLKNIKVMI